jgi:hypothetical protein
MSVWETYNDPETRVISDKYIIRISNNAPAEQKVGIQSLLCFSAGPAYIIGW